MKKHINDVTYYFLLVFILTFYNITANAANITITTLHENSTKQAINIEGEIVEGDYLKFIRVAKKALNLSNKKFKEDIAYMKKNRPKKYKEWLAEKAKPKGYVNITVWLNSTGGDLLEAINIGRAVRAMLLNTETGTVNNKTSIALLDSNANSITWEREAKKVKCMSACFLIWASGKHRVVHGENRTLGIHRAYFDPDKYKNAASENAEIQYKKLKDILKKYLLEMEIPEKYLSKMLDTPSNKIYFLTKEEAEELGGTVPYFEELMFARCGSYSEREFVDYMDCRVVGAFLQGDLNQNNKITKKKLIHKCESLSSGYLEYLDGKMKKIFDCSVKQSGLESWERMTNYIDINK